MTVTVTDQTAFSIVATAVVAVYQAPLADLVTWHRRDGRATRARHMAMYLAHEMFDFSTAEIAVFFSRDRSSVAHAIAGVKARRETGGDTAFRATACEEKISALRTVLAI